MNPETLKKPITAAVVAIICFVAFYYVTQTLLISGFPTDPRRAPDVQTRAERVVQFAVLGDTGKATAAQKKIAASLAEQCKVRGCDFLLLLGDNLYPSGMDDDRDPRMDALVKDPYSTVGVPVYMVLGNHDYGSTLDRLRGIREVRWATRTKGFEMPSSTYFFGAGPVAFWAFDTTEIFWDKADYQEAWLRESLPTVRAAWRFGFGHHPYRSNGPHGNAGTYEGLPAIPYASGKSLQNFFETQICGTFDIFFSGHDHSRQWIEHCNTGWVISGAGATATGIKDRGNQALFEKGTEGFVWVEATEKQITIAFYDAAGNLEFEGMRTKDGPIMPRPPIESVPENPAAKEP